ncbi:MAG: LytR/AlgR family response regulator transcription factor [Porcipelethomonas sp.]
MMIKIAICDDEEIAVEKINRIITECLAGSDILCENGLYTDPLEFLSDFKTTNFQALFIDLDMPVRSGFEISEEIRKVNKMIPIIYVTNRDDLVYQAFRYKAIGFIRKNHAKEEIPEILPQLIEEIKLNGNEISITNCGKLYRIKPNDIMYIVSDDHDLLFHLKDVSEIIRTRGTISSFAKSYNFSKFIAISAGCLVNYTYIFSIENDCIYLNNNEKLYIPRRKIKMVKESFLKLSRGGLM